MEGLIIKVLSNDYTVLYENNLYVCKATGKFRTQNITPLVGDYVEFDLKNKYITKIKTRKNSLLRPPIANIDQALIVASTKEPDFSTNLLDKLITIIQFNNIKPVIILSKLDLLNSKEIEEIEEIIKYYRSLGYKVLKNTDIVEINKIINNKISVLTGQTGSGKSSLLNRISPSLNLKTDIISKALGRGKHTTRHVELMNISGGLIADTPGFSSLSLDEMTKENIRDSFLEFDKYKEFCEYRDCMHLKETKCGIKDNPNILKSRYDNYKKFLGE